MKYIFSIIIFSILFVLNTQFTYAAEDRQPKTITGKVWNPDNTVAKKVPVSITCKTNTLTTETTVNGNYTVQFGNLECEQFDTVTVLAKTDTLEGSTSKVVTFALTTTMTDIILSPIPSPSVEPTITGELPETSVPEFGSLSAIMAGSLSIGIFAAIKRFI